MGLAIIGVWYALAWPGTRGSNCGGNSAALWKVGLYCSYFRSFIAPRETNPTPDPDLIALVRAARPDVRDALREVADGSWNHGSRFLVAREPFRADPKAARRILIVCDRGYQNVPRRLLGQWLNAPTHAAGFSDGSTGLISGDEFATLDRTCFAYLDEVLAGIGASAPPEVGR